ncbi:hypothetical protein, partial [Mesorhizobium sp.]|uniref:hypothetical protein n=1 Tax=Mesorhizobium sp. TaxID=1871066 RepID=UPI0025CE31CE
MPVTSGVMHAYSGECLWPPEKPFILKGYSPCPENRKIRTKGAYPEKKGHSVAKIPGKSPDRFRECSVQMFRRHKPWADRSGIGEQRVSLRHD